MLHSHPLRIAVLFVGTLLLASPAYAGGGGWLIKPLGLMLGGAMLITLVLSKIQQTSILSFIAMGVVMCAALAVAHLSLWLVVRPRVSSEVLV